MKITVQAKAGAKENKVEDLGGGVYRIWVKAPAVDGKANSALTKVLAEHFGVSKSSVCLCLGQTSKRKVFEILTL